MRPQSFFTLKVNFFRCSPISVAQNVHLYNILVSVYFTRRKLDTKDTFMYTSLNKRDVLDISQQKKADINQEIRRRFIQGRIRFVFDAYEALFFQAVFKFHQF